MVLAPAVTGTLGALGRLGQQGAWLLCRAMGGTVHGLAGGGAVADDGEHEDHVGAGGVLIGGCGHGGALLGRPAHQRLQPLLHPHLLPPPHTPFTLWIWWAR